MGFLDRLTTTAEASDDDQGGQRFSLETLIEQVKFLGNNYPVLLHQTLTGTDTEGPDTGFQSIVSAAYRTGGPVFACILARGSLFSEVRFQWQRLENGRPGALFGTPELRLLEKPWPNGTTGELMWRAEQDVSLAGNFFVRKFRNRLWRLRPDWVTIVLGSELEVDDPAEAIDAEVIGYLWAPSSDPRSQVALTTNEIAHWSPIPDPTANYRGMSWITPILREVSADTGAVTHKGKFFEHGATPNLVVMPDASVTKEEFDPWKETFLDSHMGSANAWKTLFLGGGSSIQSVGLSMKDMDYKGLMGISETRIAAAAGVPPIIAGFSEGLASATYSNYSMARRKFGDHWARPQWRSISASLENLLVAPSNRGGSQRLWYDDRDIAFLREDMADEASIRATDAGSLLTLFNAGWEPDAAVAYVATGNLSNLIGTHSGLKSVQNVPSDEEAEQSE